MKKEGQMKRQLDVIKKIISYPCYVCNPDGKKCIHKGCKTCDGKGNYKENFYYLITKDKKGRKIAFDSDTLS